MKTVWSQTKASAALYQVLQDNQLRRPWWAFTGSIRYILDQFEW
jgi:hypothetical protein